jgi:hypothetical protein
MPWAVAYAMTDNGFGYINLEGKHGFTVVLVLGNTI